MGFSSQHPELSGARFPATRPAAASPAGLLHSCRCSSFSCGRQTISRNLSLSLLRNGPQPFHSSGIGAGRIFLRVILADVAPAEWRRKVMKCDGRGVVESEHTNTVHTRYTSFSLSASPSPASMTNRSSSGVNRSLPW